MYVQITIAVFLAEFLRQNGLSGTGNNSEHNLNHDTDNKDVETLLQSTYINIAVTLCAIAVAILAGQSEGNNFQQVMVIMTLCLTMSTSLFCLVALSFKHCGRFRYICPATLTAGMPVGPMVYRLVVYNICIRYQHPTSSLGYTLLAVFLGISLTTWLFAIPASRRTRKWDKVIVGTFILWAVSFVIAIVTAEITMTTWVFDDGMGYIVPLTASGWQLRQIMAVCIMVAQIWGVVYYYRFLRVLRALLNGICGVPDGQEGG